MRDEEREEGTELHVVGAAILSQGRCLAALRGPGMSLPGKWELPGGKVRPGEDPRRALQREIEEELGLVVQIGEQLGESRTSDGHRSIRLEIYQATVIGGRLELREHAASRWLAAADLPALDWAEADRALLPRLGSIVAAAGSVNPPSCR